MDHLDQIYELLNGSPGVAKAIGVSAVHARQIKRRDSMPVRYWPRLIDAVRAAGYPLTERELMNMHLPPAERRTIEAAE